MLSSRASIQYARLFASDRLAVLLLLLRCGVQKPLQQQQLDVLLEQELQQKPQAADAQQQQQEETWLLLQ